MEYLFEFFFLFPLAFCPGVWYDALGTTEYDVFRAG